MRGEIFEDLFVLELANNHQGSIERAKNIIFEFSKVIKANDIKAAIKLQFRDCDNFIHKDFKTRYDIEYVKKVLDTKMSYSDYEILINEIKNYGFISMATPFDETSAKMCGELDVEIIKIASCDLSDKPLIEEVVKLKKPAIISTGGATEKEIDETVKYFEDNKIPLAINHCVSIYPTDKKDLELNRIDYLINKYPNNIIGFSTHEYNDDIEYALIIAYAKGARTFERHIDIPYKDDRKMLKYCSTPKDLDKWIKAYKKTQILSGNSSIEKRVFQDKEIEYLNSHTRGIWAKKDLKTGQKIKPEDIYFAIPLQKGQLSCKNFTCNATLLKDVKKDSKINIDDINL